MGTVIFQGDPPFELFVVKRPKAIVEDDFVTLALPVSAAGPEQPEREIRVLLRFGHARGLATELRDAAIEAQKRAGK